MNPDDTVSELDKRIVQDKLHEVLKAYLDGNIGHQAYSKITEELSDILHYLVDSQGESLKTKSPKPTSAGMTIATLVSIQCFAAVVKEQ